MNGTLCSLCAQPYAIHRDHGCAPRNNKRRGLNSCVAEGRRGNSLSCSPFLAIIYYVDHSASSVVHIRTAASAHNVATVASTPDLGRLTVWDISFGPRVRVAPGSVSFAYLSGDEEGLCLV